jgi:hypothetical protein
VVFLSFAESAGQTILVDREISVGAVKPLPKP